MTHRPTIALRPVVQWFAEAMERKLRKNDHKGGWRSCTIRYLRYRLREECVELELALDTGPEKVLSEAADVAGFAMMIADVLAPGERDQGPVEDAERILFEIHEVALQHFEANSDSLVPAVVTASWVVDESGRALEAMRTSAAPPLALDAEAARLVEELDGLAALDDDGASFNTYALEFWPKISAVFKKGKQTKPGVYGHAVDPVTHVCAFCACGGGPPGDGPCPARDQTTGELVPMMGTSSA